MNCRHHKEREREWQRQIVEQAKDYEREWLQLTIGQAKALSMLAAERDDERRRHEQRMQKIAGECERLKRKLEQLQVCIT